MKAKKLLLTGAGLAAGAATIALLGVSLIDPGGDYDVSSRTPAAMPRNYDLLSACEKQAVLWENIQKTAYTDLPVFPDFREFGFKELIKLKQQELSIKGSRHSDFAPEGWRKYLHARGSVARVKFVAKDSLYTGVFKGAECALLRLSLTYKVTKKRPVAPGLAFKVLRDGKPSANVSALVSLYGQKMDFNFFANRMSNIVPIGNDFGQELVHMVFKEASRYPEELLVNDWAKTDAKGEIVGQAKAPRQLIFEPGDVKFASETHDVRKDFASIPEGTIVYRVLAVSDSHRDFDYGSYTMDHLDEFARGAVHVGDIITTSEFVASSFGDDGLFFRHEMRPKDN